MITWAQQYVPASSTVVLASTTPIFAFLITWGFTRHEPATLLKLAGAILGLAGTAAIIGLDGLGGLGSNIFAEIVILLATISFACATIFGLRLSGYDPMVVAAGSLLFGGLVLLPASLILDHPWTLRPTPEALAATIAMGIFSSAIGLMLFYMCLIRLGTLITNAQSYLRIPIGVALSVVLLGESVPSNLALGLVLVMAGVVAMTIPELRRGEAALDRQPDTADSNFKQPQAVAQVERSATRDSTAKAGPWISLRSHPGYDSNLQDTAFAISPHVFARVLPERSLPRENRGRRESRAHDAPAASRTK